MKLNRCFAGFLCLMICGGFFMGCTSIGSLMTQGGTIVDQDYQPNKILISYRAEGSVPEKAQYFLVETDAGLAIWEKIDAGAGGLMEAYRKTDQGEHFSAWVVGQPASEIIVPFDRSQPAERYVYPVGKYEAKRGTLAVIPLAEFEPVARLYPE
jgi:hypothetical protein